MGSLLDIEGHDGTDIDEEILVLGLIKVDMKTIDLFNKDDQTSQQSAQYPDQKQLEGQISSKTFLLRKARILDCQNYVTLVPKADSNIMCDTEGYLVSIACINGALKTILKLALWRNT